MNETKGKLEETIKLMKFTMALQKTYMQRPIKRVAMVPDAWATEKTDFSVRSVTYRAGERENWLYLSTSTFFELIEYFKVLPGATEIQFNQAILGLIIDSRLVRDSYYWPLCEDVTDLGVLPV